MLSDDLKVLLVVTVLLHDLNFYINNFFTNITKTLPVTFCYVRRKYKVKSVSYNNDIQIKFIFFIPEDSRKKLYNNDIYEDVR